jgi:hypothetical protein
MAGGGNKLAAVSLAKLLPGMHGDGGGLWLQVTPGGRSWIFRYTFNRHAREMGLGSFHTFSLADAREEAKKCRKLLAGTLPDMRGRVCCLPGPAYPSKGPLQDPQTGQRWVCRF